MFPILDHTPRILKHEQQTPMDTSAPFDHQKLLELAAERMPFGKYTGRRLVDLPEPYVVWLAQRGFPKGKLGDMLHTVYEIKVNGLEYLFDHPSLRF